MPQLLKESGHIPVVAAPPDFFVFQFEDVSSANREALAGRRHIRQISMLRAGHTPFANGPLRGFKASRYAYFEVGHHREKPLSEGSQLISAVVHRAKCHVLVNAVFGKQLKYSLDVMRRPSRRPLFDDRN